MTLEGLIAENLTGKKTKSSGLVERGIENLTDLYTAPEEIGAKIGKYAFDNSIFGMVYNKLKGNPKARKELGDLVSKSSEGLVSNPGKWREAFKQYFINNMKEGLGEKAGYAKDLIYGIPNRLYPYMNTIADYSKYFMPFPFGTYYQAKAGAKVAGKAAGWAWGKVKGPLVKVAGEEAKDAFLKYARPLGYVAGAYTLYKVAKYLLQRKRIKKDRTELDNALSQEDLEDTIIQLRDQNQRFREMAIKQRA